MRVGYEIMYYYCIKTYSTFYGYQYSLHETKPPTCGACIFYYLYVSVYVGELFPALICDDFISSDDFGFNSTLSDIRKPMPACFRIPFN